MEEKHGTWPANARVDVDYSKGKPKIKFDYPENGDSAKKQADKQNRFGPHSFILIIIMLCFIYYPLIQYDYVSYPSECNFSEDSYESNFSLINHLTGNESNIAYKSIYGYNITCGNETYKIKFNTLSRPITLPAGFISDSTTTKDLIKYFCLWFILPIILFFIVNRLVTKYLIRQKWYQKWLPKHQAEGWLGKKTKKYIKFTPEDVENNMVEIPMFNNVELDYKTDGEFSDKLERIRIREHQYYKYKKGKVGKKKVELYKWYARFYFKDKPKTGSMEIIFQ